MRLSHDESHLSEGTMSPQNSILNQFNGFLDRYLENMMQQHCFGRWINESIPYGLESSNTKAVQLLAKTIVAKLDNEEYLPNKDGGTSPKNQVHEELLYPNFVSFLFYQCNINPNNPFLVKHENEIRLLEKEGDNIWGENVREELN